MTFEKCDTLYYQGMNNSQVQALKYIGNQRVSATTGELMWCTGRNNFLPINVINNLFIGEEIADVNLRTFNSYFDFFNPIHVMGVFISWLSNRLNGFQFSPPEKPNSETVRYHAPIISNITIGQKTDIESHKRKYQRWQQKEDKTKGLILFGVSRGTAATFCALSQEKYPEVRLVILEGAIDSIDNVLKTRPFARVTSFFTQYVPNGISPLQCVNHYPENVPTVFITSEIDTTVPCENTVNIAQTLAGRGKNDVYLLKLKRSSHPNYMFDDVEDRTNYECFINAVYKKYHLHHDPELAQKGEDVLRSSTLFEVENLNQECRL